MTNPFASEPRRGALRAWLLARTALSITVLGLAFALFSPEKDFEQRPTTILMEAIVAFSIASSFAIAGYVERGSSTRRAGAVLLVLDVALVSASVAVTGGAGSVLAVLYGAVIVGAATTLGGRAAFLAGGISIATYCAVALGLALGYLPHPPDQSPHLYRLQPADLAFAILSNVVAMTIVALLSDWLAVQLDRTGGALQVSESDRERLAARNEAIVRSIGSGLVTLDGSGRITSVNPAGLEILRATASDTLAHDVRRFLPNYDSMYRMVDVRAETEGVRLDGSRFPVGYSLASLRRDSASEDETLVTFQDLTEIQRLEAAARDAAQLATLGRVAATLAHEIRNPLGSISGSVEMVRESDVLPDEDKHLLAIVVREVDRIDQLVRDMLDVARRREAKFEALDLAEICRDVARIAPSTSDDRPRITVEAPTSMSVVADADMIRQVLWNLLKNAMQAAPPRSEVRITVSSRDGGGFELVVEDEGPGIPASDLERIFDAFHTRTARGVGLGLALVRQIVAMHRGSIDASNRETGGARFRVRIPELEPATGSDPDVGFGAGSNPPARPQE